MERRRLTGSRERRVRWWGGRGWGERAAAGTLSPVAEKERRVLDTAEAERPLHHPAEHVAREARLPDAGEALRRGAESADERPRASARAWRRAPAARWRRSQWRPPTPTGRACAPPRPWRGAAPRARRPSLSAPSRATARCRRALRPAVATRDRWAGAARRLLTVQQYFVATCSRCDTPLSERRGIVFYPNDGGTLCFYCWHRVRWPNVG